MDYPHVMNIEQLQAHHIEHAARHSVACGQTASDCPYPPDSKAAHLWLNRFIELAIEATA